MKSHWILVANAARARLLQRPGVGRLSVLQSFQHPENRERSTRLGRDAAGREMTDRAFGGAAYQPRLDAQHKQQREFARDLAAHLERGARDGECETLSIFAPSPFLGQLKHELGDAARRVLVGTYDVDLSSVGIAEMDDRIRHEMEQVR